MKTKLSYNHTIRACYVGYVTQAIVANFAPLLFLTLQKSYRLSLEQITLMVTLNFLTQLTVDFLSARFVDKIGYRPCIVAAHVCAAVGLVGLTVFPEIFPTPLSGLLTAVVIYAIGGGIIEVLISPIIEACPADNKAAAMSMLHAFFSWGSVATVLISTLLFAVLGMENWKLVSCLWALIPLYNVFVFLRVPIARVVEEGETMPVRELVGQKLFWIMAMVMLCAGASELAISQWASAFAESGLQVSKAVGDLAGPCLFALLMGLARVLHVKIADRVPLETCMTASAALCIVSYAMIVLPTQPVVNLMGCALSGFAVGILWPGTVSIAARRCPRGGTAMFALLALSGDTGCTLGPTLVGFVSSLFADDLKTGIAAAILFPVLIVVGIALLKRQKSA